jgi:hypothetical protein
MDLMTRSAILSQILLISSIWRPASLSSFHRLFSRHLCPCRSLGFRLKMKSPESCKIFKFVKSFAKLYVRQTMRKIKLSRTVLFHNGFAKMSFTNYSHFAQTGGFYFCSRYIFKKSDIRKIGVLLFGIFVKLNF